MEKKDFENRVAFAIGTGRCGTQFLARLMAYEPEVHSVHERNALNETFHRYSKWYDLPIDNGGFLKSKELEIVEDLKSKKISFEASAFLSISVKELYEKFGAKFVLLVRSPEKVVNSYLAKGWYENQLYYTDKNLALGYQENTSFHHFLGRPVPVGDGFAEWNKMSKVGKLAWYWNELNDKSIKILQEIPENFWMIQKIEDLNYESYQKICQFLSVESKISSHKFNILSGDKHSFSNTPTIASWTDTEIQEFQLKASDMARYLGYEYEVKKLEIPHREAEKNIHIYRHISRIKKKASNIIFPKRV